MTTKAVVDRKSLYLPKPDRWEWDKLSDAEIEKRYQMARDARAKLYGWRVAVSSNRDAMWAELRGRLDEALMSEVQTKHARIEDAGKQLKQMDRLLREADDALAYIDDRMGGGRVVV